VPKSITAFRSSFWVTFITSNLIALFGVLFLVAAEAAVVGVGMIYGEALLIGMLCGAVAGAFLSGLAVLYFKTYAGPDTLRCTDAFGRYATVTWGSIHTVRPINLILLKYLRLDSGETDRVIWLPLFLTDLDGFADLVREYAGPDHPLAAELDRQTSTDVT
jgi:hypothetical protein